MRSAILMLQHLGMHDVSTRLRRALRHVVVERQILTRDLGGEASTSGFADAVVETLDAGVPVLRPETD
jgi:isocitrate dehydrogenase (NAD+)